MDVSGFNAVLSAVLFGNALTGAFIFAIWKATKLEKDGTPSHKLPFWIYAVLLFVLGILVIGITGIA